MPSIKLSSGASFKADRGTSILSAAEQAHVLLPYSCKTGRCSTCRCKVIHGSSTALQPEAGLTAEEIADGWILSCVRTADSDLVLETEDLGDVTLPPARTLPCKIAQLEKLAPDVLRVQLRLPPLTEFSYFPGQYVDIIGPGGVRRSYSLANANFAAKSLELHIRAVEGGALSAYWFGQARPNDLLRMAGPLGTFFLRDIAGTDLVFLATGTGIAPVKAILESLPGLPAGRHPRSVTVLWGGRTPQDLYLDLGTIAGGWRFVPVLSRADERWEGCRGHVQEVLLGLCLDLSNATVYACGSDAMIHGARETLARAGLPPQRFHSDAFVCSARQFST